jgi:hypothetical protein
MKRFVVVFFLIMGPVACQTAKTPTYEPTEVQSLRLQLDQMRAREALVQFQQLAAALNKDADAVKTENKWPATVIFNPDTLKFSPPLTPPPTPAPKLPPPPGVPPTPQPKKPGTK